MNSEDRAILEQEDLGELVSHGAACPACGGQLATPLGRICGSCSSIRACGVTYPMPLCRRTVLYSCTKQAMMRRVSSRQSVVNGRIPSRLTALCWLDFALSPVLNWPHNPAT
jgi:hypothetical protein